MQPTQPTSSRPVAQGLRGLGPGTSTWLRLAAPRGAPHSTQSWPHLQSREWCISKNWSLKCSEHSAEESGYGDGDLLEDIDADQDGFEMADTAKNAIIMGLKRYESGRYDDALVLFQQALDLPGSGVQRFRNKPREISTGEKMAALYNIACCYSGKDEVRAGLKALAACLEIGYDDFNQLRTDPDLQQIRQDPRFEPLLERFEPRTFLERVKEGFGG